MCLCVDVCVYECVGVDVCVSRCMWVLMCGCMGEWVHVCAELCMPAHYNETEISPVRFVSMFMTVTYREELKL